MERSKEFTARTKAAGPAVAASDDDPQYEVESETAGRSAVHKPDALKKKGRRS
ncbi:DUF2945 domain-containing protein [Streptomyces sp. NPDC088788]|uniref:DUF2945 domain-containing protein n=1 Tax=Streptomyces sp. NPDC088788 TaxID=3365898 RepID=UPI00380FBDCB